MKATTLQTKRALEREERTLASFAPAFSRPSSPKISCL
jgi:hypothetical protein